MICKGLLGKLFVIYSIAFVVASDKGRNVSREFYPELVQI